MPDQSRQDRSVPVDSAAAPLGGATFDALVGRSAAMLELKALLRRVAAANSPVLVVGETGTGKETVARIIHRESRRHGGPFVTLSCGGLSSSSSLDGELFGQAGGTLPGAFEERRGVFTEADGGTLFLDEVSDMPPPLQTRMLRILQTGELRAVGSDTTQHVDVRCVAATCSDLQVQVERGEFRADLFFRLNVVPIRLPPLRERPEDVPLLVEHLLAKLPPRLRVAGEPAFTPDAMKLLEAQPWPGNVRELANLVERLVVTSPGGAIDAEAVQAGMRPLTPSDPVQALVASRVSLDALEQRYIAGVLQYTRGNKTRAAEILGIDPSTLYRREKHRSP